MELLQYEKPEAEVILFEADDIIRTSGGSDTDTEKEKFSTPASLF